MVSCYIQSMSATKNWLKFHILQFQFRSVQHKQYLLLLQSEHCRYPLLLPMYQLHQMGSLLEFQHHHLFLRKFGNHQCRQIEFANLAYHHLHSYNHLLAQCWLDICRLLYRFLRICRCQVMRNQRKYPD